MQRVCRADEGMRRAGGAMKVQWLSLVLLLCLLLTGCAPAPSDRYLVSDAEGAEEYVNTLGTYLSGYDIREPRDAVFAEVENGNAVVCYDVQAIPALNQGVGRYWYPQVLGTVVIAVDRTRTDIDITGWNSLRESQIPVGIGSESIIRNMLAIAALSYGLNPEEPAKQDALAFLEHLNQNGKFELNDSDAPILLCMDYEAVAWNREGGQYEIIVPAEGTLSYRMGLLSDVPLTPDAGLDEALLSAGLPLVSGERPWGFPSDYRSAHVLEGSDYDWFLEITGDSSRDLRRQVFHTRLYTSADLREHILSALLAVAVILLWKGSVSHRMVRHDVRRVVDVMSWLMVGWLLLRLFKYQLIQEAALSRMCWYGYYIFQLALPVTLLYLVRLTGRAEGERKPVHFLWPPFVCYGLSVLLVMTNDFHQLVFVFDPDGNWASDYGYGAGFWFIAAASLLMVVVAVGKLFYQGRRSTYWGGKVFPLLFCAGLFAYVIAYIYRVPLAWESDPTVIICVIAALFFETVLHAGLIPVNVQYQRLFSSAPIGLTLLDENGRTILSSLDARPISSSLWKRLLMDMDHPLLRDSQTQLHAVFIPGGMAVWQEDLSQLNRLRQEIQDVQTRLEAANALLQEEGEIKKRLYTSATNRALFEHLDRDLERRVTSLAHLLETLAETEHSRDLTAYIALCLCHIKRRCNLFFLARQDVSLLADEMSVYLDELAELASYAGMQILIRSGQSEGMKIRNAAVCYDFAFEIIAWAWSTNTSPVMGCLESEGAHLVFRFLLSSDTEKWHFSEELMAAVSSLGGRIACKDLEDAAGIVLTLPLGGEECG